MPGKGFPYRPDTKYHIDNFGVLKENKLEEHNDWKSVCGKCGNLSEYILHHIIANLAQSMDLTKFDFHEEDIFPKLNNILKNLTDVYKISCNSGGSGCKEEHYEIKVCQVPEYQYFKIDFHYHKISFTIYMRSTKNLWYLDNNLIIDQKYELIIGS